MDPDDTTAPVREGDVVAGKYRVERRIGSGGMGFVVAAHHLTMDEPVALKFLLAHQSENREVVERLMREARATFRLRSAHTVRVHDVGELPAGNLYIVMELLEGRDLRAELAARGPLPPREVVSYALDACDALHEAHALGIVHRDLKPGNLFLTKSAHGRSMIKVLDFGMSKLDPALYEGGPLTLPETALGTPRYMAPEQWQSAANVDLTADIWALGVVMYELLVGKPPLHRMQLAERQARLLAGAVPMLREVRPDVPEELERIVMHCLRADPRARWGSAAHLARALRRAFPQAALEAAEITKTGVTAVVPADERARQAARAFEQAPRSAPLPETRRETPEALATPISSSDPTALRRSPIPRTDDFETTTEVRAPSFTPTEGVAASGADVGPGGAPSKPVPRMSKTLRSYEGDAPNAATGETTLRLAGAPPHPAVAGPARTTAPLPPAPAPAPAPVAARVPPQRNDPPLPAHRLAVYVVFAVIVGLLLAGVAAWMVLRRH